MKVKICCEDMKGYMDSLYIRYDGESAVIDTSVYEENEVEIEYCPFCGNKIELEETEECSSSS